MITVASMRLAAPSSPTGTVHDGRKRPLPSRARPGCRGHYRAPADNARSRAGKAATVLVAVGESVWDILVGAGRRKLLPREGGNLHS